MAAAFPEFDFNSSVRPVLIRPTNPTDPAIGEAARVGADVSGLVYATHPTNALLAYVLLSGGYGQTVAAVSVANSITQGEKLYMTDVAGAVRPTYTNDSSGNTFVGYAMPADEAAAATDQLVANGATGNVMCWFRPE